jgi:hypothetical protein
MKVFIWESVSQATENYHSSGGVTVFAKSEKRARELANAKDGCLIAEAEKPDYVRAVSGEEEKVFIFPNAGCC